jgi:hypothetical protein
MRDKWYSDNRDLIKWSVLLLLARRINADRIIQIALLNASDFGDVEIDGKQHPIPQEVLSHFREIRNVIGLSRHPRISVFDCSFTERSTYLRAAMNYVASFNQERCVVFLDPDTGLEPNGGGDAKHVLNSEVRAIWEALPKGSLFVFYQHETNKAGKPWVEQKRTQLAKAIGIPIGKVGVASGPKIAKDVVFFHASKA